MVEILTLKIIIKLSLMHNQNKFVLKWKLGLSILSIFLETRAVIFENDDPLTNVSF